MFDMFLAVILLCSLNGSIDTPNSCQYVQDKLGPVASKASCLRRLDKLWVRLMNNEEFLTRFHKEHGDFKLGQKEHKGYCIDPQWDRETEIRKYYFP